MEALLLQARDGLTDRLVDAVERVLARNAVIGKYEIDVDRQARQVAHEQIDGGPAFKGERVVDEHQRRDARQQPGALEIGRVHGFKTRSRPEEPDTQGRLLPVGNRACLSFAAQGCERSCPSFKHKRTVLTLVQEVSSSRSTLARKV